MPFEFPYCQTPDGDDYVCHCGVALVKIGEDDMEWEEDDDTPRSHIRFFECTACKEYCADCTGEWVQEGISGLVPLNPADDNIHAS